MPELGSGLLALPQDTISLLKSSQVVTSVWSGVKEMVENSLDAGATNIEVRLEDFGLNKLSVRDNGSGVDKQDVPCMVMPHTTSKLRDFTDLSNLETYGFRGEALASLCGVSSLSITTRTSRDLAATIFTFDTQGLVKKAQTCAGKVGTEVVAENLFVNLPVRRNYYKNAARKKEELKKVERLLQAFSIINTGVRFSLHHNKSQMFGSLIADSLAGSLAGVLGRGLVSNMESFSMWLDSETGEVMEEDTGLRVEGMVPSKKVGMGAELGRCSNDKTWVFVNKRPVEMKEVEKLARELFSQAGRLESDKYPVCCLSISVSGGQLAKLDQNLEPNKQRVGLGCRGALLVGLETVLRGVWKLRGDAEQMDEDLDDTYGAMLKENGDDGCPIAEPQKPVQEPCFTTIGQTQTVAAVEPVTAEQFCRDNTGLVKVEKEGNRVCDQKESDTPVADFDLGEDVVSQSFHSEEPEMACVNASGEPVADFDLGEETVSQFFQSSTQVGNLVNHPDLLVSPLVVPGPRSPEGRSRPRSPVLKQSMFDSPELPGVDAVYINRLRDGEELFDDYEVDDYIDDKERPRNPFIKYECDEGEETPVKIRQDVLRPGSKGDKTTDDGIGEKFAKGQLVDQDGSTMQPVKLFAPPNFPRTPRSEPVKRKYNPDESVIRIDDFLAKRAKTKKGPIGDQTLARIAAPQGTPVMKVKKHILSRRRVDVPFNISKCFQKTNEVTSNLVGPLMSGWVAKDDSDLMLIYPPRMREMLLYERLLSSHVLPSEKLAEPMTIYPGLLNKELAGVAISMFTNTRQCPAKITDRRITFNGFSLGLYQVAGTGGTASGFSLKLEAKCPSIQYFGVDDLVEILKQVLDKQGDSVKATRPAKVREYLAGEATRMSRELPVEMDREGVEDLLTGRKEIVGAGNTCLHGKEMMRIICSYRKEEGEEY